MRSIRCGSRCGSIVLRHAPAYVASAFVASRLARQPGGAYGCLPAGTDCAAILARALVAA